MNIVSVFDMVVAHVGRKSELTPEVMGAVGGFCGDRFRHLMNNFGAVCECYLEIGSLHGASLTSTCYGNDIEAYAIENFSEFDGNRETLTGNATKFAPKAKLIFGDCWLPETIAQIPDGKVDLYFYDGCHSVESQEKALTVYASKMADQFIYIVDDWNWPQVQEGARRGIAASGLKILRSHEQPCPDGDASGWWNGVGIFVLQK